MERFRLILIITSILSVLFFTIRPVEASGKYRTPFNSFVSGKIPYNPYKNKGNIKDTKKRKKHPWGRKK